MRTSRTLLFVACLMLPVLAGAQVQRKVLLEHFTQASCGPCATYNPGVQAILTSNPNKMVPIKYQVWWPGSDPMYNHNPADVQARVAYYPPSWGVPHSQIDGAYWGGHPASWSITTINTRYAVPSPFEVKVSHSIPGSHDSVYVRMVVRAAQAFTGNVIAHMVVQEEHIHFASAPGTNGETDFYNVMKKMLPSAAGTTLPGPWAAGDSVVLTGSWKFANVYDYEQIAVAAFVQDPTTRYVHQAEYSPPLPPTPVYNYDVALLELGGLPATTCSGDISAMVTIKNWGANPLTSLDIKYQANNGTIGTHSWTGNLAFYNEETIPLSGISFQVEPVNALKIWVENPNGQQDEYHANDTATASITKSAVATNTVVMTLRTDNSPQEITWELKDSDGNVLYSGGPYTQAQTMFTETFALTWTGCYTFAMYDAGGNGICCANGTGFYRLTDENNVNFIAGSVFDSEHINEFEITTVGLEEPGPGFAMKVHPNPMAGNAAISLSLPSATPALLQMFDITGNKVWETTHELLSPGTHTFRLDAAGLRPGLYMMKLEAGDHISTCKINVIR